MWQVDHELVVSKTIEEAIEIFKVHMGKDLMGEPKNIKAIGTDNYIVDYDALIKEETNTIEVKEVDLEKEFYDFLDTLIGKDNGHLSEDELFEIAKHFLKLGLNVNQKGE